MDMYDPGQWGVPKPPKRVKTPRRLQTGNAYRDRSIGQEDEYAARLTMDTGIKYERVPMSGSSQEHPGDVRPDRRVKNKLHRWLTELKDKSVITARGKKILSIELDWLTQIMRQADAERCLPALVYRFTDNPQSWVVIRYEDFSQLLKENKDLEELVNV